MNQIKIAFFDIDGTLIDMNKKKISEKMIYTLQQLKENGIIICIATGRSPMALPKFEGITFDAYLTFNGSYCYNTKESMYSNSISSEDVETILNNAKKMHRPVSIATDSQLVSNGKDADLIEYYSFANLEIEVSEDFYQIAKASVLKRFWSIITFKKKKQLPSEMEIMISRCWKQSVQALQWKMLLRS